MLNARLTKNTEKNGFELRLYETVDEKIWSYLVDKLGMNWFYSKTEKNQDGKRLTVLYRSFDESKPQNIKGTGFGQKPELACSPEQAYKLLQSKVAEKVVMKSSKTTEKAKSKTASKSVKKSAPKKSEKAKDISKMTKAELIALIGQLANAQ